MPSNSWTGSGGYNGQSSIGGISAVNPQAQGDYQQYIDASFQNAKQNLQPIYDQQWDTYNQQMVNMGLPVGGEAYGKAFTNLNNSQQQGWNNAAFDAMKFGLDVQNQDFTQDYARSQLANALLQSKWSTDLGYAGIDADKYIADMQNKYNYAALSEDGRQFDLGLGENARQYDLGLGYDYTALGENARQFDDTLGLNYADLFSGLYKFDETMDYNYFNADRDDMRWLTELGYDAYNDQIRNNQWSDQLGQYLTNPYDPQPLNTSPVQQNYDNQWQQYLGQSANNNLWWQNLMSLYGNNSDLWGG